MPVARAATPRPTVAQRRRALRESARALAGAHGLGGVTLEGAAAGANVTASAAHRLYPDTDTLVLTVGREWSTRVLGDPARADPARADPERDPADDWSDIVAALAQAKREDAAWVAALFGGLAGLAGPEWAACLAPLRDEQHERLREWAARGRRLGVVRRTLDPAAVARTCWVALAAVALSPPAGVDESLDTMFDCLLHGLLKSDV